MSLTESIEKLLKILARAGDVRRTWPLCRRKILRDSGRGAVVLQNGRGERGRLHGARHENPSFVKKLTGHVERRLGKRVKKGVMIVDLKGGNDRSSQIHVEL